jgi:hypothetical protein
MILPRAICLLLLAAPSPGPAAEGVVPLPDGAVVLDVGTPAVKKAHLRRGWSTPEGIPGRRINWTNRMEADIEVTLAAPADREVEVTAFPFYIMGRRQRAGLFVNNRFAGDWVYGETPDFETHRVRVPAALWQEGTNTLTLRVAYIGRNPGRDRRKLGLKVDSLSILPAAAPAEGR